MDGETDEFEFDFFPEQQRESGLEDDADLLWEEESTEAAAPPRLRAAGPPADVVRRRRIAAGAVAAFVLLIVIIVLATSGGGGGGGGAFSDYLAQLSPIASDSAQAGDSLASALGGKQTVSVRQAKLDDLVQQAIDDVKRLQAITPPAKLATEHAQALAALDLRLRGLQGIKGALSQTASQETGLLAGSVEDLVTSDLIWENAVRAPGNAVLQANGAGGEAVPSSSVVPDPKTLLSKLRTSAQTQTAATGPVLSLGSKGQDVVAWQNQLNRWLQASGSSLAQLTPDGTFGASTQAATQALQTAQGLTPDGIVGASTRQALQHALAGTPSQSSPGTGSGSTKGTTTTTTATLSLGSKGQDVVAWQNQLNQWLRATAPSQQQLTPDGTFGAATQTATESLQTSAGLTPTGIVDAKTRQALAAALARSG